MYLLLRKEPNAQVCDATDDAQSCVAGLNKKRNTNSMLRRGLL